MPKTKAGEVFFGSLSPWGFSGWHYWLWGPRRGFVLCFLPLGGEPSHVLSYAKQLCCPGHSTTLDNQNMPPGIHKWPREAGLFGSHHVYTKHMFSWVRFRPAVTSRSTLCDDLWAPVGFSFILQEGWRDEDLRAPLHPPHNPVLMEFFPPWTQCFHRTQKRVWVLSIKAPNRGGTWGSESNQFSFAYQHC